MNEEELNYVSSLLFIWLLIVVDMNFMFSDNLILTHVSYDYFRTRPAGEKWKTASNSTQKLQLESLNLIAAFFDVLYSVSRILW